MKSEFFLENLSNPLILIPAIYKEWRTYYEWEAYKEFIPEEHKVASKIFRPDKDIYVPCPDGTKNADGSPALKKRLVPKNRLPIPLQQSITLNKTAFATGGKIKYISQPQDNPEKATLARVMQTLKREKTDPYKNAEIVKSFLSQTEVCEIWYTKKDNNTPNDLSKVKIKSNIYTPYDGNQLIPVFDEHYDLIAFGLGYKRKDGRNEISCLDLYDDNTLTRYEKTREGNWTEIENIEHFFGKIPVVYYSVRQACWQIVQPLIERIEFLLSNHADTNDYNGSPILLAIGEVKGFSEKGEPGKVVQAENGADLRYIESANTPESIKMEWDNLWEIVYTMTNTANTSMEKMAELTSVSGAAIERMLMNAHLGAMDLQNGVYGIGVQRRLNLLVSACANIYTECKRGEGLDITPEFSLFRLDNVREQVEIAALAKTAGLADDLTLINYAGLADDPEKSLGLIRLEDTLKIKNPT